MLAVLATSGAVTQLTQTQAACTLLPGPSAILSSPLCAAWLEPPFRYKDIFHAGLAAEQLQASSFSRIRFKCQLLNI